MADWTDIATNTLLPGEPWTSSKALAAFENPQAIAEGASGAPKVQNRALAGLSLGVFDAGNGVYSGLTDLDNIEELFLVGLAQASVASNVVSSFSIRFSDDNGASWASAFTLEGGTGESLTINEIKINLDTASVTYRFVSNDIITKTGNAPSGDINAFQLRVSGDSGSISYFATALKGRA